MPPGCWRADPAVAPERVWAWIRWADKAEGASSRERLAGVFGRDRALRAAVLEHALTTPHPGGVSAACRELGKTGLGIGAAAEDHDGLAEALRIRSENRSIDPRTWWDIIELARPMLLHAGQDEAAAGGEGETPTERGQVLASLPAVLDARGPGKSVPAAASELKADGQSTRAALAGQADKVAAGDYRVLAVPAAVYLGRIEGNGENADRDPSLAPAERLRDFLGEELCERVLEGFVAVLGRDDLPPASAIAQIHCAEGEHEAEAPLICAVDVALRRSLPLDRVERASLEAACMAWQCAPGGEFLGLTDIGPDLEAAVFRGAEDMERHYRSCIEPRLACNAEFVNELDGPARANGVDFHSLIGGLSLEWLRTFPQLNGHMQTELMICALENSPREAVRELIVGCRGRVHPDDRAKLMWLSVPASSTWKNTGTRSWMRRKTIRNSWGSSGSRSGACSSTKKCRSIPSGSSWRRSASAGSGRRNGPAATARAGAGTIPGTRARSSNAPSTPSPAGASRRRKML